jgi:hypothetical protein
LFDSSIDELAARHRELDENLPRCRIARHDAMIEIDVFELERREAVHLEPRTCPRFSSVAAGRLTRRDQRLIAAEAQAHAPRVSPASSSSRRNAARCAVTIQPPIATRAIGRCRHVARLDQHQLLALDGDQGNRGDAAP